MTQPAAKARILLVDDQPVNLLALRTTLEDLGHDLVDAPSGEEALRRLLRDDFAVVLLDVRMPGLDGFEIARLIRRRKRSRHTPIIFLTAYETDRGAVEQAYALGAVDFLVKPLAPVALRAKVSQFVELFEKVQQVQRQAEQLRQVERREFERRLAEEALRRSEARLALAAIVEASEDAIISQTLDGIITSWNAGAEHLFGYATPEVMGRPITMLVPPDSPDELPAAVGRLKRGEKVEPYETVRVRKDGRRVDVSVRLSPLRGGGGEVVGVSSVARDISERKRLEEELQRTVNALAEADRRKDEFLATLAHELRNPLAPVRNAVQLMRLQGLSDTQWEWARDVIERQVRQLSRLVDDLLDISRISRGKVQLRKEVVNVAAVVRRAVETSRPLIDERDHELTVSVPAEPVFLEADPTRLEQVLANLLNNAAKYTEPGGRIGLTAQREGGSVAVQVRDTGIGIAPDVLPRVFDLFVQAEPGKDRAKGGLGIGLSVVRNLVEMHGGGVTAHSGGQGQGSEFVVRLPALAEEQNGRAGPAASDEPPAAGPARRILVVDDNVDAAESLARLLGLGGHEVRVAHEGEAALAAVQAGAPDIVFLDIGLPGRDGHEVAGQIRRRPGGNKILLVALTGWGAEEDRRRTKEAGFDHHLLLSVARKR
jgi:PAS domain S-box-containing protein